MKRYKNLLIVGIDHSYGNIKTGGAPTLALSHRQAAKGGQVIW